jgi:N-acetylglucosaminyldiphosphoundecaprenol N-acetyl-beta-D-mannosaminyltransferase
MSLIILSRLAGYKVNSKHRVTNVDLFPKIVSLASQKKWKLFYLGSEESVLRKASNYFLSRNPNLKLSFHHGYFSKKGDENGFVLRQVTNFKPDILFVGMGMPKQEQWVIENWEHLPNCLITNSGALMDYFAGKIRTPPRWLGPLGLEWLYRLISEPKRLSYRYLIEPWQLLPDFIYYLCRKKKPFS